MTLRLSQKLVYSVLFQEEIASFKLKPYDEDEFSDIDISGKPGFIAIGSELRFTNCSLKIHVLERGFCQQNSFAFSYPSGIEFGIASADRTRQYCFFPQYSNTKLSNNSIDTEIRGFTKLFYVEPESPSVLVEFQENHTTMLNVSNDSFFVTYIDGPDGKTEMNFEFNSFNSKSNDCSFTELPFYDRSISPREESKYLSHNITKCILNPLPTPMPTPGPTSMQTPGQTLTQTPGPTNEQDKQEYKTIVFVACCVAPVVIIVIVLIACVLMHRKPNNANIVSINSLLD